MNEKMKKDFIVLKSNLYTRIYLPQYYLESL